MAPLRGPNDEHGHVKRAQGALEATITKVLLDANGPLNAGEVRDLLADRQHETLAYSTVVTILTRLYEKNVLTRSRDGRAFRYAPVADEAGLAAHRLNALLNTAPDRDAVLTRFVGGLSPHDERLLRQLLEAPNAAEA